MKTRIYVHTDTIGKNFSNKTNNPPIMVEQDGQITFCHEAEIQGPSRMVYVAHKAVTGEARVWIEAEAPVICHLKP